MRRGKTPHFVDLHFDQRHFDTLGIIRRPLTGCKVLRWGSLGNSNAEVNFNVFRYRYRRVKVAEL